MWRDVLGEAAGVEPRLAGSGSTWFVEGTTVPAAGLQVAGERAPLLRVRTVPPEWEGD